MSQADEHSSRDLICNLGSGQRDLQNLLSGVLAQIGLGVQIVQERDLPAEATASNLLNIEQALQVLRIGQQSRPTHQAAAINIHSIPPNDATNTVAVSADEVYTSEANAHDVGSEQVSTPETGTEEVNTEEVNTEEVNTEEVNIEEVSGGEDSTARQEQNALPFSSTEAASTVLAAAHIDSIGEPDNHPISIDAVASQAVYSNLQYIDLTLGTGYPVPSPQNKCHICFDQIKDTHVVLKHASCSAHYHADCALEWLGPQGTCPHCRVILRSAIQKEYLVVLTGDRVLFSPALFLQLIAFLRRPRLYRDPDTNHQGIRGFPHDLNGLREFVAARDDLSLT